MEKTQHEHRNVIREVTDSDAASLADIYNEYIVNSVITFEQQAITAEQMQQRIEQVKQAGLPWIVAVEEDGIVGYAYATKWRDRAAYRFSVESTVYLSAQVQGKGLGTQLYQTLFSKLKQLGIQSVIAGITLPNPASVALHEKMAMKKVAHFPQVGFKFEQWLDVGYWQINLNL